MSEVTCLRCIGAQSPLIFCADKYTGQPDTFVELKTSLAIRGDHDSEKFEKYGFELYHIIPVAGLTFEL